MKEGQKVNSFTFNGIAPFRQKASGKRKMGYFICECGKEKA